MTYKECIDYLYNRLPVFHRVGAPAYKASLDNIITLCDYLDNPQNKFKSIHVAGTNGKGSTCHMLASILMEAGYKTGLHTSPHLLDFTERIKVNGKNASNSYVVEFVKTHRKIIERLQPSFFEISVAMAFDYFAKQEVDIAVVEVGLGGRLDSTNILIPELSVITNIGLDHTQFLGNTLADIAKEKAGIIKKNVPVVIGETQTETCDVFNVIAQKNNAPVFFADRNFQITKTDGVSFVNQVISMHKQGKVFIENCRMPLRGEYQYKNVVTTAQCVDALNVLKNFNIDKNTLSRGLERVVKNTELHGRFEIICKSPTVICDGGHNAEGIKYVIEQILSLPHKRLHVVLGFVNDKKVDGILGMFPSYADYYFTQADIPRALSAGDLKKIAAQFNLKGNIYKQSIDAICDALNQSSNEDIIYIGGSNFIVAEILAAKKRKNIFAKTK